jgi:hypothetical protein
LVCFIQTKSQNSSLLAREGTPAFRFSPVPRKYDVLVEQVNLIGLRLADLIAAKNPCHWEKQSKPGIDR